MATSYCFSSTLKQFQLRQLFSFLLLKRSWEQPGKRPVDTWGWRCWAVPISFQSPHIPRERHGKQRHTSPTPSCPGRGSQSLRGQILPITTLLATQHCAMANTGHMAPEA